MDVDHFSCCLSEMGDGESRVMAEKRHSEALGVVACGKLPRLEAAPSHVLAAGLCRSSVLPGHASDGHYSYQGAYFSYPLQCHEAPKLSTHWSPAKSYVPCMDGAMSQQIGPEKAHCMLYRPELEGSGVWVQNSSYEKRKDCLAGDTLAAQEKWAQYSGRAGFIQQGWIQGFSMPHSSRVPTGCPPLAAPKPVYRNHVYCTDAGCNPKGSLATVAESLPKQPTNVEWTVPSSGHPMKASCGSAVAKKTPVAESGFLSLHQSWKEAVAASTVLSPYRKTFENLQVAPSASAVDASYPAVGSNQKNVPEECARSPCGKVWSKLPPPASPLATPQGLLYQERTAACCSLPPYSLTSHEQLVLYQQSIAQTEKQNALFALPACKSFNFPAGEDPQLLSRTCFPPAPQSYYPGHLESYFYQTLGSPPVTSSGLKTSKEHESRQNSRSKISLEQRSPISACSVAEKPSCGRSLSDQDGVQDWPRAESTAKPASESFWCRQATPQPRAFQPSHPVERLPSCLEDYRRTREAFYVAGPGQQEKSHSREEGPLYAGKQSSLSPEDKKRDAGKSFQPGACIVIPDSPIASHDSCFKGDSLRSQISEHLDPSIRPVLRSPDKEPRDLKRTPPSSPPMPVIHNVFSLAPYREYLEGSTDSLHLPSTKGCPVENPSPEKSWQNAEETTSLRPPSARSSIVPEALPDSGKDMAYNAGEEGGRKSPSSSCIVMERESRGYAVFCENYRGCPNAPAASRQGAVDCASELAKDDHVLDLSLKTEGLVDMPHAQRTSGKMEALERGNGERDGESAKEGQEAIQDTDSLALQLPQKNSSKEKSNFQSSAAFLYTKFKILKSHAAGSGSVRQQNFPLFQSSFRIAALSNNFSLQRNSEQAVTQPNDLTVQQSCQQAAMQQNSPTIQQSCQRAATQHNGPTVQQHSQQVVTQHNSLPVQQSCRQAATQQNSLPVQTCQQVTTQQNSLPVQQSCWQVATQQNSLPVQSCQQVTTQQNSLPVQPSCQQAVTQQNSLPVQPSCQKGVTQQVVTQSCRQVTRQNSLPVQQSFQQTMTRRNSLPAPPIAQEKSAKPSPERFLRKSRKQPDASKLLPPAAPARSPALGEVSASLPPRCNSPTQQASPKRYFTALHASVCAVISDSVSTSSPELLREWLEKVEPEGEPKPKEAKSRPKTPEALKPSNGKRVWLDFGNAAGLLGKLRLQLETFLFTRKCPFPHVVRAGTLFIPIYVVKEKLFGNLPGSSVDHVLQDHKVELRPTTLSEEKLLRELDLKTCSSRMLKLLALKQLPDIYPDLLDLHWRHCVKEKLGSSSQADLQASK